MNKSLLTNLIAACVAVAGYFIPGWGNIVSTAGIFALSGALTNWLAVYMLFDKVPLLYGSGVIPERFEEFKAGIRSLMMTQFFTKENIDRLLNEEASLTEEDRLRIIDAIDYNSLFDSLKTHFLSSGIGPMLKMINGEQLLEGFRGESVKVFRDTLSQSLHNPESNALFSGVFNSEAKKEKLLANIQQIVDNRLDELTPQRVKEIIQEMIRKHLGWLVVWGGLFGGVIGLIAAFAGI